MSARAFIGKTHVVFDEDRVCWVDRETGDPVDIRCDACGDLYTVDLILPDKLWRKIQPEPTAPAGGLLCPACIGRRLENLHDGQSFAYRIEEAAP